MLWLFLVFGLPAFIEIRYIFQKLVVLKSLTIIFRHCPQQGVAYDSRTRGDEAFFCLLSANEKKSDSKELRTLMVDQPKDELSEHILTIFVHFHFNFHRT